MSLPSSLDGALQSLRAFSAIVESSNANTPDKACMDEAELQAVILFPALGTPYVAPASEKTIKLYLIAEAKCTTLFRINPADHTAPLAWYFLNKHLRLLPFSEAHKTSTDLHSTRLYGSTGAAQAGIKVWYRGTYQHGTGLSNRHWGRQLYDHQGQMVATLRQSAVDFFVNASAAYGPIAPACVLPAAKADVRNQPLEHLFEIELSTQGLRVPPQPGQVYTLAWMVTNVYRQATAPNGKPVFQGVTEWEHQDKLIYDFLWMMKEKQHHFWEPFTFNVPAIAHDKLSDQLRQETSRLKAYHPVMFSNKPALHIGHLSDVHISSRHFALARSEAQAIPGVSDAIGPKLTNSFMALRELFDSMRGQGADAIFLTGDLLDFNQNFNPLALAAGAPKDQWAQYDLSKQFRNGQAVNPQLYPRGLDDMLAYSLIKYSYLHGCPVFMTTGNHEAYDVPYGIGPRFGGYTVAVAYKQTTQLRELAAERRAKAKAMDDEARQLEQQGQPQQAQALREQAQAVRSNLLPGEPVAPGLTKAGSSLLADPLQALPTPKSPTGFARKVGKWLGGGDEGDFGLPAAVQRLKEMADEQKQNAYAYASFRANAGVAADHNLTIYEACMAYGPSYGQFVKGWNFTPANFDWFFMLFTPLADYALHYGDSQTFIGLDWGDSEIMVNADMSLGEAEHSVSQGLEQVPENADLSDKVRMAKEAITSELMGNLIGLPRSDKSINREQQVLLQTALQRAGSRSKNVLFTHFTMFSFDSSVPYSAEPRPFVLSDDTFNEYTRGTFSNRREWLLGEMVNGGTLHYAMSGHSHRAGVYRLDNRNPQQATVSAYEPALVGDESAAPVHQRLFDSPRRTRLIVSSCGGPVGVQNLDGQLFGWNLRPPAGTLLKTDAIGLDECRRVVTKSKSTQPRFCAALDHMVIVGGLSVLSWVPVEPGSGSGQYYLIVSHLDDANGLIAGVEFYTWRPGPTSGQFASHMTSVQPEPKLGPNGYRCDFADYAAFASAAAAKKSKGAPVLAKVSFNKAFASKPQYTHFNFDDPWIFPVSVDPQWDLIQRPEGGVGEVPKFQWLNKNMKADFGFAGLPDDL